MAQQANKMYFAEIHSQKDQPHVLNMQWQFFRLLFPYHVEKMIKDVHLGKLSSTVLVSISQKGRDCILGLVK